MVFIVKHFSNELDFLQTKQNYATEEVLCCGSSFVENQINQNIPYHPLITILPNEASTIAQQHAFIDAMCRAIQIEVPSKIVIEGPTLLDTHTVWHRIEQHAAIVGIPIEKIIW
jgi:hypothetical protein